MKIFLSHNSLIDQVANTSATVHTLNIFTNAAEDYAEMVSLLQKALDAIKALSAEGKKTQRRINIVLSTTPIPARVPLPPPAPVEAEPAKKRTKKV
jgi:hypothetical protein